MPVSSLSLSGDAAVVVPPAAVVVVGPPTFVLLLDATAAVAEKVVEDVVVITHCLSSFVALRVPSNKIKALSSIRSPAGEEHAIATREPALPAESKAC